MSEYEIGLLVERAKRQILMQKIIEWERANGLMLMPMKPRDLKRHRIEQLVDESLEWRPGKQQ